MERYLAPILLAFSLSVQAFAEETQEVSPAATHAMPTYPDKPSGLKNLIRDVLRATKENDEQTLNAYLNSLALPDPDIWFKQVFGERHGQTLAVAYEQIRGRMTSELPEAFRTALREQLTDVDVLRYEKPCGPQASEFQYPFLLARQWPEPLYEVRLTQAGRGKAIWFFAYVSGGFRYIGLFRLSAFAPEWAVGTSPGGPKRIRVGGQVQTAKLIRKVQPVYPEKAQQAHMQGTVRLMAVIDHDGNIKDLRVLEGRCWLAEAAVKAVNQ